jgi:hypothetical protein
MPFGTVPVWDFPDEQLKYPIVGLSPMPFGTVPVWDKPGSMWNIIGAIVVSNAFRHGPGLGR